MAEIIDEQLWGFQQIVTRQELDLGPHDVLTLEYVPEFQGYRFHISVTGRRRKLEEAVMRLSSHFEQWARRVRETNHTRN